VPNPFELGRQGLPHEHIQFGTGTVDPLAGVEIHRAVGRFSIGGWMLAKTSLYANGYHYQAGSQLLAGANVASSLWLRGWSFLFGALVYDEAPERWNGVTETEGNLGRVDLMVDTSVQWHFAARWTITVAARIPFFTHAVGAQLATPAIGELAFSRAFDLGRRAR